MTAIPLHTTPIEYLCNYRIEQSIELLNNTDYSITDIAGMVGFHSASIYAISRISMGKRPGNTDKNHLYTEIPSCTKMVYSCSLLLS